MGGAASCFNLGISDMSLRRGAVGGRVSIALASGAATVFKVGEVDPTSEKVSSTIGVAPPSLGFMVSTNGEEGTTVLGFDNCERITFN